MKTPGKSLRSRQKEQTQSEIARVAFDLFAQVGYDEVSMERISEMAGVSRATLFNYFPRKELILPYIARLRVERLKELARNIEKQQGAVRFDDIFQPILEIARENVKVARRARKLLLRVWFQQALHGHLAANREDALTVLSNLIERVPRRKRSVTARQIAEIIFALMMSTTLEWLMNDSAPNDWLPETLKQRLELTLTGVA